MQGTKPQVAFKAITLIMEQAALQSRLFKKRRKRKLSQFLNLKQVYKQYQVVNTHQEDPLLKVGRAKSGKALNKSDFEMKRRQ